jgi:cell wall-associated NlpC family hydrolase
MSEDLRAAIVAEALTWDGTPFQWQQAAKGPKGGADCKGFIWGIARELGMPEAESSYAKMRNYGGNVDVRLLHEGLQAVFQRVEGDPGLADVIVLRVRGAPNHLAIVTGEDEAMLAQLPPVMAIARASLSGLRRYGLHSVWRWSALCQ